MAKFNIKNINPKKAMNIALAVGAGIVTIVSTISDQNKEEEFENMKKALSELQNK